MMSANQPLTDHEKQILRTIVGHVIPASGSLGVPGADDETIFADILTSVRRDEAALREAIDVVDGAADGGFLALSRPQQAELLGRFRQSHPTLARSCEVIAARCYYRDDRVMRAIGMEPRPPFPLGFDVVPSDLSLLDPVRQRGKIYREVN
ncbi:MAG: hypothetical protein EOP22_04080 [Hyphomicrobiales bacterium]|nr:MAG: hypothetical protein EOP22_04080 [Hyphomicrobiales bacterium]